MEVEGYLDGELKPKLGGEYTEHLSGCTPCMDRAEFRRHLKVIVATQCTEKDVPEALLIRIRAIIAEP